MNFQKICLWHFPMSRSARVKWLLHELFGDDFEVIYPAIMEGALYEAEALARNPNHAVPVLELTDADGNVTTMIESGAMITFLADLDPDKQLAPTAGEYSPARADYLQNLYFHSAWMDMMLWQLRLHYTLLPEDQRDRRTIDRYREKIRSEVEPQLMQRLESGGYICGDNFTAADCVSGHNVIWAGGYGLCQGEVFEAYVERLGQRPAFQAAFSDRDQFR